MTKRASTRTSRTVLILLAAVMAPAPVLAESACKGLEKAACETKSSCNWVNGYTRQNGTKVSGHCRSSPKKKPTASSSTSTSSSQ
ncbi:hypothetical protein [Imhoffiella purpurea]|uniref:hypothetical protein n=1 Tax=Imhoffiella purpurea TaxID=1249627 RepID=UPI0012FD5022|nr:hypothetical protein [Imhoffiella purpurea]